MSDVPPAGRPTRHARPTAWWLEEVRYLLELLVLTAFAVAQPLLDITGRSADFFVYHRVDGSALWPFALTVAFVPPVLLWLGGAAFRVFGTPARRLVHLVQVAGLLTVLCYEIGKQVGAAGPVLAILGLAAGVALAVLLARSAGARRWITYATPAPLVFVMLFIFTSSAGALAHATRQASADTTPAPKSRPPIVMVFMDEFPLRALLDDKGQIDARLFPNFARLARGTTWYNNATGISGWTPFAVPSMLTGKAPYQAVGPSYLLYPDNLFTLLAGSYRVHALETISELCPPDRCDVAPPPGRAQGLKPVLKQSVKLVPRITSPYRANDDPMQQFTEQTGESGDSGHGEKPAATPSASQKPSPPPNAMFRFGELKKNQPERFTTFLGQVSKPSKDPSLYFLHILLPHVPYVYLPDGSRYAPPKPLAERNGQSRSTEVPPTVLDEQRLLLQLVYTDGLVGQLLDALQKSKLWDESLFVLTADHGSGMKPGDKPRHLGPANPADLMWVPLFIKRPGQTRGGVDDRNYMHTDLVPTIADVIGLQVPWQMDGRSAFGPRRADNTKVFYDKVREPQKVDGDRWLPLVRKGLASEIAQPGNGVAGLFRLGPHGDLVGRRVTELAGDSSGLSVSFGSEHRPSIRRASGSLPGMVWGAVDGAGSQQQLAIAVNGVVAGVTTSFRGTLGPRTFGAMVDPRQFHDGANTVDVYVIDTSAGSPRLRPTRVS